MTDAGTTNAVEMADQKRHVHDDTKVVPATTLGHHGAGHHGEGVGVHAPHTHDHAEHGHSHGEHGHSHGNGSHGHAHEHGHMEGLKGHHGHDEKREEVKIFDGRVAGVAGHHGHHEGLHDQRYVAEERSGRGHHGHGLYGGHGPAGGHIHSHDHTHVHHGHGDVHDHGGGHGGFQGTHKPGKYRLKTPNGTMKVRIYEKHGTPPEFRIKFKDWQGPPPSAASVSLQTNRGAGAYETFVFADADGYLKATKSVPAPHNFRGEVSILGHSQPYAFDQHEAGHAATHKHKPSFLGSIFRIF